MTINLAWPRQAIYDPAGTKSGAAVLRRSSCWRVTASAA